MTYNDPKVWKMLCCGHSKLIFQCESKLVQHWLKKIKPTNLYELCDVVALVRPGPLNSGMVDEYIKYKNLGKKFESFGHPIIDSIFNSTHNTLCYQEQLMQLGSELAWKDLSTKDRGIKSENLRKSVAKKLQDKVMIIGKDFVEGCVRNGVREDVATRLFNIIKASGRYIFCRSHAFKYAKVAYETAWFKVYFPKQTFSTYLSYAKFVNRPNHDKWDEIADIIQEAREIGIDILPPNINSKNYGFAIEGQSIRYGLGSIKYFGGDTIEDIKKLPKITNWKQVVLLCNTDVFGKRLRSTTAEALILTGAFSDSGTNRRTLLNLYGFFNNLTDREIEFIIERWDNINLPGELGPLIKECVEKICRGDKRKNTVLSELALLQTDTFDHPAWIEENEQKYMGIGLTASAADLVDMAVDKCIDCYGNFPKNTVKNLTVVINEIKVTTVKKGQSAGMDMAIINVHDASGVLNKIPIFSELYEECREYISVGNTIHLSIIMGKENWLGHNIRPTVEY